MSDLIAENNKEFDWVAAWIVTAGVVFLPISVFLYFYFTKPAPDQKLQKAIRAVLKNNSVLRINPQAICFDRAVKDEQSGRFKLTLKVNTNRRLSSAMLEQLKGIVEKRVLDLFHLPAKNIETFNRNKPTIGSFQRTLEGHTLNISIAGLKAISDTERTQRTGLLAASKAAKVERFKQQLLSLVLNQLKQLSDLKTAMLSRKANAIFRVFFPEQPKKKKNLAMPLGLSPARVKFALAGSSDSALNARQRGLIQVLGAAIQARISQLNGFKSQIVGASDRERLTDLQRQIDWKASELDVAPAKSAPLKRLIAKDSTRSSSKLERQPGKRGSSRGVFKLQGQKRLRKKNGNMGKLNAPAPATEAAAAPASAPVKTPTQAAARTPGAAPETKASNRLKFKNTAPPLTNAGSKMPKPAWQPKKQTSASAPQTAAAAPAPAPISAPDVPAEQGSVTPGPTASAPAAGPVVAATNTLDDDARSDSNFSGTSSNTSLFLRQVGVEHLQNFNNRRANNNNGPAIFTESFLRQSVGITGGLVASGSSLPGSLGGRIFSAPARGTGQGAGGLNKDSEEYVPLAERGKGNG